MLSVPSLSRASKLQWSRISRACGAGAVTASPAPCGTNSSRSKSRKMFSTNPMRDHHYRVAMEVSKAPSSITAIPDSVEDILSRLKSVQDNKDDDSRLPGAVIRPVGCTRRVFLLKPWLSEPELEGLAYRIATLTKNEGLNSVLIAVSGEDDVMNGCLPSSATDLAMDSSNQVRYDMLPPVPHGTWYVSSGYDPLQLYRDGKYKDTQQVLKVLSHLKDLTEAIRGHATTTKIPTITVPHGAVTDGGFCFLQASYVLATGESGYRIWNPQRGLALDPVGLSYALPRLGKEFKQAVEPFGMTAGRILALTGYEADADDMLLTGLATHYTNTASSLPLLERTLAQIPPWNQQEVIRKPIRYMGEPEPMIDHNAVFRNVAVANTIAAFAQDVADGSTIFDVSATDPDRSMIDFSSDPELLSMAGTKLSDLVDYAATFHAVLQKETSVVGVYECLKEIAEQSTMDPEEQEGINVAKKFVAGMDRASPLALSVVFELLRVGSHPQETLKSCMERELHVQAKMFQQSDFEQWAMAAQQQQQQQGSLFRLPEFGQWKHKTLAEVSPEEVKEIVES